MFWCVAIYCFTARPEVNDEHTLSFFFRLGLPEVMVGIIDFVARKFAHLALFFILAYLALKVVRHWRGEYLAAWAFATVYAMTDEWHPVKCSNSTISGRK